MFSTRRHGDFSLQRAFASVPGVAEGLVGMVNTLESLEMLRAAAELLSSADCPPSSISHSIIAVLPGPRDNFMPCCLQVRPGLNLHPSDSWLLGSWFSASVGSFVPVFWVLLHKQTLKVLWVQFQAAVIR